MRFKLIVLVLSIFLYSCDLGKIKETPEPEINQGDIISQTYGGVYSKDLIAFFANSAGFADVVPFIKYSVDIYYITYKTLYKGQEIEASGVIYIPKSLDSLTSIITFQHGTIFSQSDAPSVSGDLFGIAIGAQGMIAFVPDYIGFGSTSSIFHPYLIAESYAIPVIDMIRSGKQLLQNESIQTNGKLFLVGYSEGAYATLAAQREIEMNPSYNIQLTAVLAGSGAYDLQLTTETVISSSSYEYPAYIAYVILSLDEFYGSSSVLTDYFQEPYATILDTIFDGVRDGADINAELTTSVTNLFQPSFVQSFLDTGNQELKQQMLANDLSNWTPVSPLYLYHGTADNLVPFENSQNAYNNFVANGATGVSFTPLLNDDHESAFIKMVLEIDNLISAL